MKKYFLKPFCLLNVKNNRHPETDPSCIKKLRGKGVYLSREKSEKQTTKWTDEELVMSVLCSVDESTVYKRA